MKASTAFSESFRSADARADGATRDVLLERDRILIRRRVDGVKMKLGVPLSAYHGVVLSLLETAAGRTFYRIRDADLIVVLDEALDDRDVVAEWKLWAKVLAKPKFIERTPGCLLGEEVRMGALALGRGSSLRRRGSSLAKRKPRNIKRRGAF
jgi:hypothetical protein